MTPRIYLDHAATTPLDQGVLDTMIEVMKNDFGNPSSIHAFGRKSRIHIENARKIIAEYLNASIGEIYFTSSATESNNMVIKCAIRDLGVERFISTKAEHHSVLNTLSSVEEDIEIIYLALDDKGNIDHLELEKELKESRVKTMVSLMHANNEIGSMHNLEKVSQLCQDYGAYLHSDAVQSIGKFEFDLQKMRVNFISGTAHKLNGPKGAAFLYVNSDNIIKPYINGGSQERNLRAGTENLYGIVGLGEAIKLWDEQREQRMAKIRSLRNSFKEILAQSGKDVIYFGNQEKFFTPHILNIGIPRNSTSEMIMMNIDIAGICASSGSACSSGAEHDSHVLAAIDADVNRKAVRISFSHHNSEEEVLAAAEKFASLI